MGERSGPGSSEVPRAPAAATVHLGVNASFSRRAVAARVLAGAAGDIVQSPQRGPMAPPALRLCGSRPPFTCVCPPLCWLPFSVPRWPLPGGWGASLRFPSSLQLSGAPRPIPRCWAKRPRVCRGESVLPTSRQVQKAAAAPTGPEAVQPEAVTVTALMSISTQWACG